MTKNYDSNSIIKMDALDHIRSKASMYIGDTHNPTHLLIECLDNALDEVQSGFADKLEVFIDNNKHKFFISDNGRGLPFDLKKLPEEDTPVTICTNIYTSGKFKKGGSNNAYEIAVGTHGIGMTACYALSEKVEFKIKRKKHCVFFRLLADGTITRILDKEDYKFSTKVIVHPSYKYFETLNIDENIVKERLLIAASNFDKLNIKYTFIDSDENITEEVIKGNETHIIKSYLDSELTEWDEIDLTFKRMLEDKNSVNESCHIQFAWNLESEQLKPSTFSTVNLVPVYEGPHINRVLNSFKNVIMKISKKLKYDLDPSDALLGLRVYINLKILDPKFDAQVKNKLNRSVSLEVLDEFEEVIEKFFKTNKDFTNTLLEFFQEYRRSIQNKKVIKTKENKRGSSKLTKLKDCSSLGGELILGEGDSAMRGVIKVRDPKLHAILPLRGKVMNVEKKNISDITKNTELKDLISALGCGLSSHCDISKLRYEKVILAADADPDGAHITSLLIMFFAKLMPDLIKEGKLYVCETPLFSVGRDKAFVPLWTKQDLDTARDNGQHINRFKGLGQFNNGELYKIILDPATRRLVKVNWYDNMTPIFNLMSGASEDRKKLAMGTWSVNGTSQD